jgi:hypothetical protein
LEWGGKKWEGRKVEKWEGEEVEKWESGKVGRWEGGNVRRLKSESYLQTLILLYIPT